MAQVSSGAGSMVRWHRLLTLSISMISLAAVGDVAGATPKPTAAARSTAVEIRREALLPPNGPVGRPLPLASHWNVGSVRGTFEPAHQIELIQRGSHILPWCAWPQPSLDDPKQRDPPRPWTMKTNLPVFSMALVRGKKGARRWLLYAHSPLADRKGVRITIPDYKDVTVDIPRAGVFCLIEEAVGKTSIVDLGQ